MLTRLFLLQPLLAPTDKVNYEIKQCLCIIIVNFPNFFNNHTEIKMLFCPRQSLPLNLLYITFFLHCNMYNTTNIIINILQCLIYLSEFSQCGTKSLKMNFVFQIFKNCSQNHNRLLENKGFSFTKMQSCVGNRKKYRNYLKNCAIEFTNDFWTNIAITWMLLNLETKLKSRILFQYNLKTIYHFEKL